MDDHLGILQQGIEAVAVVRDGAFHEREGGRGEVEDGKEEDLNRGEDRARVGVQLYVELMGKPQDKSIAAEQPCPEQQGAFLSAPERREFIGAGEGAIGVFEDVSDRKIVGKDRPDQSKSSRRYGHKPCNPCPARSVSEPLGRYPSGLTCRQQAQGERSCQEIIGSKRQGDEESKTSKSCHSELHVDCRMRAGGRLEACQQANCQSS